MKRQNDPKGFSDNKSTKETLKNSNVDQRCKAEYEALLRSLRDYLESQPDEETCTKKIQLIRASLQKRIQREKGNVLTFDKYNLSTMKKLRNEILHNRKVNDFTLLEFGVWLWKQIAFVYSDDVSALYNTLSYIIQTEDLLEMNTNYSAENVTKYFNGIYEAKSNQEKAEIIKTLIPMMLSRFNQKLKNKQG